MLPQRESRTAILVRRLAAIFATPIDARSRRAFETFRLRFSSALIDGTGNDADPAQLGRAEEEERTRNCEAREQHTSIVYASLKQVI